MVSYDNIYVWCHQRSRYLQLLALLTIDIKINQTILFFIISFMLSLTLNVALTAVLYKNWIDKQLHK